MKKNLKEKLLEWFDTKEGKLVFKKVLDKAGGAKAINDLYKTAGEKNIPMEKISEYIKFLIFVKNYEEEHGEKSVMQLINQYFNL